MADLPPAWRVERRAITHPDAQLLPVPAGLHTFALAPAGEGLRAAVLSTEVAVEAGTDTTAASYGASDDVAVVVLVDDPRGLAPDDLRFRIVNVGAPSVDLVLTVRPHQTAWFEALRDVLDEAERLAGAGLLLAGAGPAEIVAVRHWALLGDRVAHWVAAQRSAQRSMPAMAPRRSAPFAVSEYSTQGGTALSSRRSTSPSSSRSFTSCCWVWLATVTHASWMRGRSKSLAAPWSAACRDSPASVGASPR